MRWLVRVLVASGLRRLMMRLSQAITTSDAEALRGWRSALLLLAHAPQPDPLASATTTSSNRHAMAPALPTASAPPRRSLVRKRAAGSGSASGSGSGATALPASLQLLEHVTFELSVAKTATSGAAYTLALAHRRSNTRWAQPPRAFDDFVQLQQRLLRKMRRGHVCSADCAFLYSFVKSYFPKHSVLFRDASACRMAKRRERLALCLAQLQQSLLARENHACPVLAGDIASELAAFLVGDVRQRDHPLHAALGPDASDDCSARSSCSSLLSTSSEDDAFATDALCPSVCALCDARLDGPAFAPASSPSVASTGSSSSSSPCARRRSYTTTLGCGHCFHDECIVPRLNEAMQCPTCGHHEHVLA